MPLSVERITLSLELLNLRAKAFRDVELYPEEAPAFSLRLNQCNEYVGSHLKFPQVTGGGGVTSLLLPRQRISSSYSCPSYFSGSHCPSGLSFEVAFLETVGSRKVTLPSMAVLLPVQILNGSEANDNHQPPNHVAIAQGKSIVGCTTHSC